MLKCKLAYPSLKVVGRAELPAKPQRGDYIQHMGVLYYVHGITMYSKGDDGSPVQILVKVTEA